MTSVNLEEAANHLARSQSTAKMTMADDATRGCHRTLPRPSRDRAPVEQHGRSDQRTIGDPNYCTLRTSQPAMGSVGGRLPKSPVAVGETRQEDPTESTRSLLYEQNMCTFENFCERRNSEHRLERAESGEGATQDGLGNFCTLRKVRRNRAGSGVKVQHPGEDRTRWDDQPGAYYCTLKRKKLQLNRKFVESFLEDPNAKVVDYLSELDAYLDEMDGVDDAYDEVQSECDSEEHSRTGSESHTDEPSPEMCQDASGEIERDRIQYYLPSEEDRDAHAAYQQDRIRFGDIKHFCTLPKQKRTQFLNAFKRGASLRRTVVGQPRLDRTATRIECEDGQHEDQDIDGECSSVALPRYGQSRHDGVTHHQPQPHPSWHRHSMRKKHLIELPEQEIIEHGRFSPEPAEFADRNEALLETTEYNSLSTLPMGEVPALVVALPPSPVPSTERYGQEQIVASAPPASCTPSPVPVPLETDLDVPDPMAAQVVIQERPRQVGRRAQSQPRIGSITVVRDAATNELVIHTNSVPEPPTAPPFEGLGSQEDRQGHQHQYGHHRRYGGESEGSSIGSSRNPSPVSLLSTTTTYSSITSAPDNANDRTRRQVESSREGAEDTGASSVVRLQETGAREEIATVASSAPSVGSSLSGRRLRGTFERQRRNTGTSTQAEVVSPEEQRASGQDERGTNVEDPESDPEPGPRRSSRRSDGRPKARWPHAISRSLATTFCTLGLYNISRFAVFSVHFGANFVVQFLLFSLLFGIPMLWLQMVLGARIRGGPVTMWRISPICKGIGIALLLAQALVALYSAISLAWVLVYFRDAFIMRNEKYRWQEPFEVYRGGGNDNQSFRLPDTVADYFNGVVLQRYHLAHQVTPSPGGYGGRSLPTPQATRVSGIGAIRFQLAFNMAILWTLVFVALCRGIRSLGKLVVGLFLCAFVALAAVCAKFLTFINYDSVQNIFPATDWQDFFLNSRSWTSAAQETFLTWGLLGISIYAINCRSSRKGSFNVRTRRELRRDAFLVPLFTVVTLLLAAVLGSACVQILNSRGYYYFPGSYENLGTNVFLRPANQPLPPQHATMPNRWLIRYSTVTGESFKRSYVDPSRESGFQALRLVTELLPAALAAATPDHIQPVWGLLGYLALVLFGLGQLCVMWKPVAGAIGDAPSSILLSCVSGLLLGMPLATEGGISIVHYLDTILGAAWWVLLLWIGHILALFLVRGRPFTSDILVNDLQVLQSFSAFVAFAWNFLLPIGLIFMCIIQYRLSNSAALFNWSSAVPPGGTTGANNYWPLWARQVGGFVQVSFLLLVPIVMVVQIYRYLCRGPPDILDRVDLLLRPPVDGDTGNSIRAMQSRRAPVSMSLQQGASGDGTSGRDGSDPTISLSLDGRTPRDADDAPPKYTPPPSYTTATGARIAKLLRNSIRRSVRRLMGESSGGGATFVRHRSALPQTMATEDGMSANPATGDELPPPDYCSALQQYGGPPPGVTEAPDLAPNAPRVLYNSATLGSGRRYRSLNAASDSTQQPAPFTASDVRQVLRPGVNQPVTLNGSTPASGFTQTLRNTLLRRGHSMENLVLAAAPLGDSSIITLNGEEDDESYFDDGAGSGTGVATGRDSVI
ncbi:uncharacterized protein LOC128725546 [Anopheles nili]|uniref:uncharacterized protein LOC128725546 n=1 Tax=Anopheles nili TaxID=185578 RepID=UPI00237B24ED|nr:uncharacterized protein LOC128725546 [Anopheles nili]